LGPHLKAQVGRELDRLELLLDQIKAVEAVRDAMLAVAAGAGRAQVEASQARASQARASEARASEARASEARASEARASEARASEAEPAPARTPSPGETPLQMLMDLKGVGPEFAAILWTEGLSRSFANRRQIAAYAGLAPTPWQSGSIDHEQGVSKSGNSLLRTTMIQMAWLWLRHQPRSALSRWFQERQAGVERAIARTVGETADKGAGKNARKTASKRARKTAIVALARKLLVALWKYVSAGVVIEEAEMKRAAAGA
jgi:transposase